MSDVIPGVPSSGTINRAVVCKSLSATGKRGHGAAPVHPAAPARNRRQTPMISGNRKFPIHACNWKFNRSQHAYTCISDTSVYTCAHCCGSRIAVCRSQAMREKAARDCAETGRRHVSVPVPGVSAVGRRLRNGGCVFGENSAVI